MCASAAGKLFADSGAFAVAAGGLPIGSAESQQTAWGRVFDFFEKTLS